MKIRAHDFYLLRISFLDFCESSAGLDIFDFISLALINQATPDTRSVTEPLRSRLDNFRAEMDTQRVMPSSNIRNRIFTYEEYSALLDSDQTVLVPDDYLETEFTTEENFSKVIVGLKAFILNDLEKVFTSLTGN